MNKKKILKIILIVLAIVAFLSVNVVYAAANGGHIKFCDYSGVRKTFKIFGLFINLVKVLVPIILILTSVGPILKNVQSGKAEDLKASFSQFVRKLIAGLIIFVLPTIIDYAVDELAGQGTEAGFTACTNCLLDVNHCNTNIEDPDIDN